MDRSDCTTHVGIDHLMQGSSKQRFQCGLVSAANILYLRVIQGHSGRNRVDPSLQDDVITPSNFVEFIYHVGCTRDMALHHPVRIDRRRQRCEKRGQTVFFTAVNFADEHLNEQEHRDVVLPVRHSTLLLFPENLGDRSS